MATRKTIKIEGSIKNPLKPLTQAQLEKMGKSRTKKKKR